MKATKRCSTSLITRESKATIKHHFIPVRLVIIKTRTGTGKDVENGGASCTVGENVNGAATVGTVQQFLKTKNRTRWSSNLVFTQREQMRIRKDMCTLVFVAALLTTAMK